MVLADLERLSGRLGTADHGLREQLHQHRQRVTPIKLAVLAALSHAPGSPGQTPPHVTARDMLETVDDLGVRVNETSIYRTVDRLTEVGLVHQVAVPGAAVRYGLSSPDHHHAVCVDCRAVWAVPVAGVAPALELIARAVRLQPAPSGALTLNGYCGGCRD